MKYALFSLILLFSSCKGQEKSTITKDKLQVNNRLELVVRENFSGSDTAEFLIIKDSKSLQKFYGRVNRTRKPGLPLPEIDFSNEVIVVYSGGEQNNTSKISLLIESETDKSLFLTVVKDSLKQTTKFISTPFLVYKLPLTQKKIILK